MQLTQTKTQKGSLAIDKISKCANLKLYLFQKDKMCGALKLYKAK